MTDKEQRPVSFPPGETEYVETFIRTHYADGTHVDTPPESGRSAAPAVVQLARMFASIERTRVGRSVRMQRTVKVVASEWEVVVPPAPEQPEVVKYEQADPNDYCQRQLCGHAYGLHEPEGEHACSRCGNPDKCSGFVAKRAPADA
jgi:hypothetical protein